MATAESFTAGAPEEEVETEAEGEAILALERDEDAAAQAAAAYAVPESDRDAVVGCLNSPAVRRANLTRGAELYSLAIDRSHSGTVLVRAPLYTLAMFAPLVGRSLIVD